MFIFLVIDFFSFNHFNIIDNNIINTETTNHCSNNSYFFENYIQNDLNLLSNTPSSDHSEVFNLESINFIDYFYTINNNLVLIKAQSMDIFTHNYNICP